VTLKAAVKDALSSAGLRALARGSPLQTARISIAPWSPPAFQREFQIALGFDNGVKIDVMFIL
jgi:hypothetical protein